MTISSYGTGAYRSAKPSEYVATRAQFDDLQRQLSTKQKSETYGDLGSDRRTSLDLNAKVSSIDSFLANIETTTVNLKLQTTAVENFATLASKTKNDAKPASYVASSTGRSAPQLLAEENFKQTVDMLNTEVNGRYLFSGRASDTEPVASFSDIMNGDAAGRAGLKQLIDERSQADGVGGLGRLAVGGTAGTTTVSLSEETPAQPYGFKISRPASTSSAALTLTETAGPPASLSVAVGAQPLAGENLKFSLNLPDGTKADIVLTARANGTTGDVATTFEIGADATATATNLRNAVTQAVTKEAKSSLRAASAIDTATNFFDSTRANPPIAATPVKRVQGPNFSTATTSFNGTEADTVFWYKGESARNAQDSARATASVQVDQGQIVGTGARANEGAFKAGLAGFAAMSALTFSATDAISPVAYQALADRVSDKLSFGGTTQKPAEIITELGTAQTSLANAKERNESTKNYLTTTLESVQGVTTEEVATQILALQTTLQASYQVTSILSKLSLTNYL